MIHDSPFSTGTGRGGGGGKERKKEVRHLERAHECSWLDLHTAHELATTVRKNKNEGWLDGRGVLDTWKKRKNAIWLDLHTTYELDNNN